MNLDITSLLLSFCDKAYVYIAPVCKMWHQACGTTGTTHSKTTSIREAVSSLSRVQSVLTALKQQPSLNSSAFFHASKFGDTAVLDRLLQNKRPMDMYVCAAGAVAGENTRTLSWAVDNGFPLDRFVCHRAAAKGNVALLRRALELGCPWDPVLCREQARENGHEGMVALLRSFPTI